MADPSRPPVEFTQVLAMSQSHSPSRGSLLDERVLKTVQTLADDYLFTHLHLTFPEVFSVPDDFNDATNPQSGWSGGFNAVLGNPPWDQIQYDPRETFAVSHPEIAEAPTMAKRKAMIGDLEHSEPETYERYLSDKRRLDGIKHFSHASGRYPLGSVGRLNTAPLFLDFMWEGIAPSGKAGVIVPTGIATDSFTQEFFRQMIDRKALASLFDFENAKPLFPGVHRSYKFCLLTLSGSRNPVNRAHFSFFAHEPADLENHERVFILDPNDFALLNPNTRTCPIFRTSRDAEITKAIYRRVDPFIREGKKGGNNWEAEIQLMFMMNSDSGSFRSRDELVNRGYECLGSHFVLPKERSSVESTIDDDNLERYLPLYEGKMTSFYDHRAANVFKSDTAVKRQNQPEYLDSEEKLNSRTVAMPLWWVNEELVKEKLGEEIKWLLGFNRITSVTNERTMICAALPVVGVGDSESIIRTTAVPHLLLSALNSFAFDYIARQKVGGNHMNMIHLKQLPALSKELLSDHAVRIVPSVLELTYTAWDMIPFAQALGYPGPPYIWDDERRTLIRAELDALMFHLYGVNREETDYVMETFPIVKRKDEQSCGQFRTKNLILDRYDAMTQAYEAAHGSLTDTPNSTTPPLNQASLSLYSHHLAKALETHYQTNIYPPPAHPSQAHPASTRPSWADRD